MSDAERSRRSRRRHRALRQRPRGPPRRGPARCSPAAAASSTTSPSRARRIIVFLRSPHAHARIVADRCRARRGRCPACSRVYTGAELAAAGVKPMPTTPDFKRADGRTTVSAAAPRARARGRALRRRGGRRRRRRDRARRRATRPTAVVVEYEELPAVVDVGRRDCAGRAGGRAPTRPTTSPPRCATATPRRRRRRSRAPRMRVALDLVNQRVAPVPMEPRSVRRLVRRGERPADGAHQQPDADRPCAARSPTRCPASTQEQRARARRRRRRRLRHEDRHLPGGHRRRLRGARAQPAGAAGRPSAARSSCPRRTAATSRSHAELALDARRQGAGAARALARQRRRLRAPAPASRSSC